MTKGYTIEVGGCNTKQRGKSDHDKIRHNINHEKLEIMKNLLEVVQSRTKDLSKSTKSQFNTNDWLVENLVDKTYERQEVINMIIVGRIKHGGYDVDKMSETEVTELINKLYKTSKNGLDTSVSDSNNNSSFSYNPKYDGYKLIKTGSKLTIKKVSK